MLSFVSALIQVNQDLQTIGALAGLLAVPGLAVLSVLYFGQAREVRRLRDWAGRAPERAAELEQRVSAEAARRVQGQPGAATKPATPAAQAAATRSTPSPVGNGVASQPGAQPAAQPATVAAQAATAGAAASPAEAKPEAKPGDGEKTAGDGTAPEAQDGEAAKPAEDATGEKKADESAPEGEKAEEPEAAGPAAPSTTPEPAPAPAPGEPQKGPAPSIAAATTAAAAAGAGARPRTPAPPVPPRPAAQPLRATAPSASIPSRGGARPPGGTGGPGEGDGGMRRPGRGTLIAAGAAILVLAITVAIVLKVTGGSSKPPRAPNTVAQSPAAKTPSNGTNAPPPATRAQRAQTNVAVLNGTTVTGLARSVANRLQDQGYTIGNVTDAPNQAQPVTKVEYGQGHAGEARAVATAIKLPASRVVTLSPVDSTTAGPNAEVVVIVGQDAAR
jgi:hypothetical protein